MADEFYVHTENLKHVADRIQALVELINSKDATKGTLEDFRDAASIEGPTATFWGDNKNALAQAYGREFSYVNETYAKLTSQLNAVMQACIQTANGYTTEEDNTRTDVRSTGA